MSPGTTTLPLSLLQVREVCAFLEDELGLVPGWLLSVPVKVRPGLSESPARPLRLASLRLCTYLATPTCARTWQPVFALPAGWSLASGLPVAETSPRA